MFKRLIAAAAAFLLTMTLLPPTSVAQAPDRNSIIDVATTINSETGEFSNLIAALVKVDSQLNTGLIPTLSKRRQFTVFAPTDAAFDAAAESILGEGKTGAELIEALPAADLLAILTYHVSPGSRDAEDVTDSQRVRTVSKSFVFPIPQGEALFLRDTDSLGLNSGDAEVVLPNVFADNGVIHAINAVLIP